jgi:hypothetical protein
LQILWAGAGQQLRGLQLSQLQLYQSSVLLLRLIVQSFWLLRRQRAGPVAAGLSAPVHTWRSARCVVGIVQRVRVLVHVSLQTGRRANSGVRPMVRCRQGITRGRTGRNGARWQVRRLSAPHVATAVITARVRRSGLRKLIGPILAAVVAAWPGNHSECRGDDTALRERVRKEFPAALERLEAFYMQLSGSGTHTVYGYAPIIDEKSKPSTAEKARVPRTPRYDVSQPKTLKTRQRLTFCVSAPWEKAEVERLAVNEYVESKGTFVSVDTPADGFRHGLACAGPSYSFTLQWLKGRPVLGSFESGLDPEIQRSLEQTLMRLRAPLYCWGDLLRRVIKDPGFRIVTVAQKADKTRTLLEISYDYDGTGFSERRTEKLASTKQIVRLTHAKGSILVCPEDCWAVQRHSFKSEYRGRSGPTVSYPGFVEIEYGDRVDGMPLPRKVTSYAARYERYDVFEIDRIRAERTSADAFKLAAYGLPEIAIVSPVARRAWSGPVLWFGVAVGAAILALLFGFLSKKHRGATATQTALEANAAAPASG